jgi:predicted porin
MEMDMKKTLLAVALTGAFAVTAHAQSSVTLYGSLDAGVAYTSNTGGNSNYQLGSGLVSNTYWGLKGSEDLGNGLHAIFTLENGFNLNNGSFQESGSEFNRQAYVGLKSDQYGTVTLGRQYDSMVDYLAPLSFTGAGYGNNLAGHPFDNDNLDNTFSIKNSVKFASANYNGFSFGGLYGFSNQADGFANNRAWSAGAAYANGPINAAASYLQINKGGSNAGGATALGNGDANVAANLQRTFGGGVNYTFGPATVGLVYTNTHMDGITGTNAGSFGAANVLTGNNVHFQNAEINGRYALTPALSLGASYTFTMAHISGNGSDADARFHQISLLSDYSLSKRTDVYLEGVYQHANGSLGNGRSNVAAINGMSPSDSQNQTVVTVGMRHRF